MKNLLILTNSTLALYRFRKELLAQFNKQWRVFVSSPDDGFVRELTELGVTYIETPFNRRGANPFADFALYRRYVRLLKDIKPSIVITYTAKPNIYGNFAARRFGLPVISGVSGLGDAFLNKGIISRITCFLYKLAFKTVSGVLFENLEDEQIMRRADILTAQKTVQIPGSGVNLTEHSAADMPQCPEARFIYNGRFMRTKGMLELFAAAEKLKNEMPQAFSLILMGYSEGDVQQELEQAMRDGIVDNIGFQEDVISHIRQAHCVVLPSYNEGMSNALLEGAATARALIATDISGCREVVDDGVNGFLCKPRSAESLYECMKRFISLTPEQRDEMGRASRVKVESEFDRNIVIGIYMKLLEETIQ